MPVQNKGFITSDGKYYEAPFPIDPSHREVLPQPQKGSPSNNPFINENTSSFNPRPSEMPAQANAIPMQSYNPKSNESPVSSSPISSYTLNQDSQFNFKLKDVIIIAGAIASAAVSWSSADGRLSRLEEKVSTDIVKKIESIERKQDESIKVQTESIRQLSIQITDLERAIVHRK
jgi:hypothetical protein